MLIRKKNDSSHNFPPVPSVQQNSSSHLLKSVGNVCPLANYWVRHNPNVWQCKAAGANVMVTLQSVESQSVLAVIMIRSIQNQCNDSRSKKQKCALTSKGLLQKLPVENYFTLSSELQISRCLTTTISQQRQKEIHIHGTRSYIYRP